jgi:hypothetical protein
LLPIFAPQPDSELFGFWPLTRLQEPSTRRILESAFDDAFSLAWHDLHLAASRREDSRADQAAWRAHRLHLFLCQYVPIDDPENQARRKRCIQLEALAHGYFRSAR